MRNKQHTYKAICLATTLSSLFATFAISTLPAKALMFDPKVVATMQARHNELLKKESNLQHDYDDLRKQIDDLNKRGDNSSNIRVDELSRELNDTYADIRQVRLDIKDIEVKMM